MAKARRDAKSALLHPEQLRHRQLEVYYIVLAQEPGFEADFEGLYVLCTERSRLLPDEAVARRLMRFCEHWRLPSRSGIQDVLWTVFVVKPRLLLGDSIDVRNVVPCPRVVRDWPSVVDLARAISDPDPSASPAQALAHAETQMRAAPEHHGFRPIPPHHSNEQELRWLARRLVYRAIRELRWGQIAEAERRDRSGHQTDMRSVQSSVVNWAETLDVPLPDLPGGWPAARESNLTPAASRAFAALVGLESATFADWRSRTDLPKSTFRNARAELLDGGFVQQADDGGYSPSGTTARRRVQSRDGFACAAKPALPWTLQLR
jgi:hypothetical protein